MQDARSTNDDGPCIGDLVAQAVLSATAFTLGSRAALMRQSEPMKHFSLQLSRDRAVTQ